MFPVITQNAQAERGTSGFKPSSFLLEGNVANQHHAVTW